MGGYDGGKGGYASGKGGYDGGKGGYSMLSCSYFPPPLPPVPMGPPLPVTPRLLPQPSDLATPDFSKPTPPAVALPMHLPGIAENRTETPGPPPPDDKIVKRE
jgi:hypothetical protein